MSLQIRIHVPSQTLDLLDGETLLRRYVISTSRHGLGTEPDSYKTPTGRFRVAEKHGDGAEAGMIFRSRVPTGEIGAEDDPKDHVQTRILWLDGLDAENANTFSRYIYIHGTNAESRLGLPASEGCVRMNNFDVIDLYELVPVGTEIFIDAGEENEPGMIQSASSLVPMLRALFENGLNDNREREGRGAKIKLHRGRKPCQAAKGAEKSEEDDINHEDDQRDDPRAWRRRILFGHTCLYPRDGAGSKPCEPVVTPLAHFGLAEQPPLRIMRALAYLAKKGGKPHNTMKHITIIALAIAALAIAGCASSQPAPAPAPSSSHMGK